MTHITLLLLALVVPQAPGQDDPRLAAASAALGYLQAHELDSRPFTLDVQASRATLDIRALARRMEAQSGSLDEARTCTSRAPSSCRLAQGRPVAQVDSAAVDDDSATVLVSLWRPSESRRQPVEYVQIAASLRVDDEGAWVVTSTKVVEIS